MTEEYGELSDHLQVMVMTHTNKKTGRIQDEAVREIVEKVTKVQDETLTQRSQDGFTGSNELTRTEMNDLVLREVPVKKGRRPGLGKLATQRASSSAGSSMDPDLIRQNEELKEKITALEGELSIMGDELSTQKTKSEKMNEWFKSKFDDFPTF